MPEDIYFSQFPKATRLVGKVKWLKLKRKIISDAKKIFIIASISRKYNQKAIDIIDGAVQGYYSPRLLKISELHIKINKERNQ